MQRGVLRRKNGLSSWSQQEVYHFFVKVPCFTNFYYLGPASKSVFSTHRKKIKKSLVSFVEKGVWNLLSFLSFLSFLACGGNICFANLFFRTSVFLASCKLVACLFIAAYACYKVKSCSRFSNMFDCQ